MAHVENNDFEERVYARPPILADGGYLGICTTYPETIIPVQRLPNQHLTPAQRETNRLLSRDRAIVERYFGRLKLYWGFCKSPTDVIETHCLHW